MTLGFYKHRVYIPRTQLICTIHRKQKTKMREVEKKRKRERKR